MIVDKSTRRKRTIPLNNLENLRHERGLSMQDLGERIGKDASYINKLEKRRQNIMPDILALLAEALGVPANDILGESQPSVRLPSAFAQHSAEPSMIPIYGTAAGSHLQGAAQTIEGPIDRIEAPKALQNAKGLYGLYVVGHSMEPMFRHGSLLVVSTYKPPRVGDAVVIQEQKSETTPREATIGILDKVNTDKIVLTKLNPFTRIEINAKYVVAMHKVLDHGELLGVS